MNNESFGLGLAGLALQQSEQFARAHLLVSLLNRALTDGEVTLVASHVGPTEVVNARHWVRCDNGVYLQIAMTAAKSQAFCADRIGQVAEALDESEPVLAAIEAATGIVLEPVEMCTSRDGEFITALVSRNDKSDQIYIALPIESAVWAQLESVGQAVGLDYSSVPVRFTMNLNLARLNVEDVAGLTTGDLLLLGNATVPAQLQWGAESDVPAIVRGSYNVSSGIFAAGDLVNPNLEPADQKAATTDGAEQRLDFAVPLNVCLAGWTASAGELTSVQEGGSLHVGVPHSETAAILMAGDSLLASGNLVRIADQLALLIDRRVEASDIPAAEPAGAMA